MLVLMACVPASLVAFASGVPLPYDSGPIGFAVSMLILLAVSPVRLVENVLWYLNGRSDFPQHSVLSALILVMVSLAMDYGLRRVLLRPATKPEPY